MMKVLSQSYRWRRGEQRTSVQEESLKQRKLSTGPGAESIIGLWAPIGMTETQLIRPVAFWKKAFGKMDISTSTSTMLWQCESTIRLRSKLHPPSAKTCLSTLATKPSQG